LPFIGSCGDTPPPQPVEEPQPGFRVLTLRSIRDAEGTGTAIPEAQELQLARDFAASQGLSFELISVDSLEALLPALLAGQGEIAAANLTITPMRRKQVSFTTPVTFVREVLIARTGEVPEDRQALGGREIGVIPSSSFHATLQKLLKRRFQPEFAIVDLPEGMDDEAILGAVTRGGVDLTVLDSNSAQALLQGREDLRIAFELGNVKPIAWAVRPDDTELLQSLNAFIGSRQLLPRQAARHTDDLPGIVERGVLRVAMRNNAASYFLWRGELLGFDYELMRRFAKRHKLRLEVVAPEADQDLLQLVRDGYADLAASSLTITKARQRDNIVFSRPYNQVSEIVVCRNDEKGLEKPAALAGRRFAVRRKSSYWETLQGLLQQGIDLQIEEVPENLETESIIDRVAGGEYDLTLADSHILDIELTWRDDVRAAFALGEPRDHGWALRGDNPKLLAAVNAFLKKEYRGVFYNITHKKYFKDRKNILSHRRHRVDHQGQGRISPYDDLARRYADRYGFDWRLVTAQMYQESRFDPKTRSWAGALGLMQVLPRTAREFGLEDLRDPETGIHAGVRYLNWLRQRFEPELDPGARSWFALAAYNAGIGHVRDARKLAGQQGLDPNRWFGNVEKAMLLLSKKQYSAKARHGYVRGKEPVDYVRRIRARFRAYVALTES
jgi:membrane-bound lytic murein transglycosylase F